MNVGRNILFLCGGILLVSLTMGNAAEKKNTSPFLGDISGFKRSKERKSLRVDRHPTKRAINYKKMMFEPVTILQSPHSQYKQLTADEKQTLSNLFRSIASETFKDVVEITDTPGPGVLNVRCAIRGMKQGQYYLDSGGAHVITPDSQAPIGTLEAEAVDSVTKERIIALVDEVGQEAVSKSEREEIVPTVSNLFHEWVVMLKDTFQEEKILSGIPK